MLVNSSILSSPKAFWLGKWMGLRARALLQAGAGKAQPIRAQAERRPRPSSCAAPRPAPASEWQQRGLLPARLDPRLGRPGCATLRCVSARAGGSGSQCAGRGPGAVPGAGPGHREAPPGALQGGLLLQGSQPLAPREDGWAGAGGRGRLGCRATRGASCQRVPELLVLKLSVPPTPPPRTYSRLGICSWCCPLTLEAFSFLLGTLVSTNPARLGLPSLCFHSYVLLSLSLL